MDNRQTARFYLLLTASISVFWSCGNDPQPTATIVPGEAISSIVVPPLAEAEPAPLVQPNPEHAIVILDLNGSAEDLAAELGLTILEQTSTDVGTLVRYELPPGIGFDDLEDGNGVLTVDPNIKVELGESQTLLLGFLEGNWNTSTVRAQPWIENLDLDGLHRLGTGHGVTVAMLDIGAYLDHPVLAGKTIVLEEDEAFTSHEYRDHIDNDLDGQFDEAFGHGTHVAGGIAMVAPGAKILPIRVMNDDGFGSLWDILKGLHLARNYGADIINLSLSLATQNDSFEEVLKLLHGDGIVVVAAAGNYGIRDPRYPATSPLTVGVASVNDSDVLSRFSGAGEGIALAAPGENILSSYPRAELWTGTGTSMATPIVSGSIACVSEARGVSVAAAVTALEETAIEITPQSGVAFGRISPLDAAR